MPDRNYPTSYRGRQDPGQSGRWNERDDDYERFGREGDRNDDYESGDNRNYGGSRGTESGGWGGGSQFSRYGEAGSRTGGRGNPSDERGRSSEFSGYSQFGQGRNRGSGQENYGQRDFGQRDFGQRDYGQGDYGQSGYGGRSGYGGGGYGQGGYQSSSGQGRGQQSDSSQSWRGYGAGYGSEGGFGDSGGWTEPYGEGQQYGGQQRYSQVSQGSGSSGQGYGQSGSGQRGLHRGKGPKGYQRSDDRVKELICERLRDDPEIDPGEVTINVAGGRVTLDGSVDSRRTKRAIEDIAEQFDVEVQNNLRVTQRTGASQGGDSQGEWGKSAATGSTMGKSSSSDDNDMSAKQKRN
jgi:osmotically-inducible protein OsmY